MKIPQLAAVAWNCSGTAAELAAAVMAPTYGTGAGRAASTRASACAENLIISASHDRKRAR